MLKSAKFCHEQEKIKEKLFDRKKHETQGAFPYTRGLKTNLNDWKNTAYVVVSDEKEANSRILQSIITIIL